MTRKDRITLIVAGMVELVVDIDTTSIIIGRGEIVVEPMTKDQADKLGNAMDAYNLDYSMLPYNDTGVLVRIKD